MFLNGKIVSGALRGDQLIKKYKDRLHSVLGFAPFLGTLNIRLEELFDIKGFETKRIEHVLLDGSVYVELRLAPAKLRIKKNDKKDEYNCWIIRQEKNIHDPDIVEIVAEDNLKEKFGLKEGDDIKIEVFEVKGPLYQTFREKLLSKVFKPYRRTK